MKTLNNTTLRTLNGGSIYPGAIEAIVRLYIWWTSDDEPSDSE